MAVAQSVGRRARHGPRAAGHVFAVVGNAEDLSLLFDHNPDQPSRIVPLGGANSLQPQRR